MASSKKNPKNPADDIIHEDSGPPISEPNNRNQDEKEVDIDDAMIDEPKDNVFKEEVGSRAKEIQRLRKEFPEKSEAEILQMIGAGASANRLEA